MLELYPYLLQRQDFPDPIEPFSFSPPDRPTTAMETSLAGPPDADAESPRRRVNPETWCSLYYSTGQIHNGAETHSFHVKCPTHDQIHSQVTIIETCVLKLVVGLAVTAACCRMLIVLIVRNKTICACLLWKKNCLSFFFVMNAWAC